MIGLVKTMGIEKLMSPIKLTKITVVMYIVCIVTLSCSPQSPWLQITEFPYDDVRFDNNTHTLWFSDLDDTSVYTTIFPNSDTPNEKAKEIKLPEGIRLSEICLSKDIWVSGFKPSVKSRLILRSTENHTTWEEVAFTSKPTECKTLRNGVIVFWSDQSIIKFDPQNGEAQHIDAMREIRDIIADLEGNLWVSSLNGEIYKQDEERWILMDKYPPPVFLFIDDNSVLWATSGNQHVYMGLVSDSPPSLQEVLDTSLGYSQEMFQDNSGSVWLTTSNSLFVWKIDRFQEIDLPLNSKLLRFGAFDPESNVMFVSTEKGVFSLNLSGQ